jgi:hypothetical protein
MFSDKHSSLKINMKTNCEDMALRTLQHAYGVYRQAYLPANNLQDNAAV